LFAYTENEKLQVILDEYLSEGIIRPSESEYASPIVLVKKKSGDLRLCVDYRKLNKTMVIDNYPLPFIEDLLKTLVNKTIFSKLDLKHGYFHVFVDSESIKYTSFMTPLGQFEFMRMAMRLKNAPAVFQRIINKIFADMIRDGKVVIYMDDIMIASREMQEHLDVLSEVFDRLARNKLELNMDKCEFLQASVQYCNELIFYVCSLRDSCG